MFITPKFSLIYWFLILFVLVTPHIYLKILNSAIFICFSSFLLITQHSGSHTVAGLIIVLYEIFLSPSIALFYHTILQWRLSLLHAATFNPSSYILHNSPFSRIIHSMNFFITNIINIYKKKWKSDLSIRNGTVVWTLFYKFDYCKSKCTITGSLGGISIKIFYVKCKIVLKKKVIFNCLRSVAFSV